MNKTTFVLIIILFVISCTNLKVADDNVEDTDELSTSDNIRAELEFDNNVPDCYVIVKMLENLDTLYFAPSEYQDIKYSMSQAQRHCILYNLAHSVELDCKKLDPHYEEACQEDLHEMQQGMDEKYYKNLTVREVILSKTMLDCEDYTKCFSNNFNNFKKNCKQVNDTNKELSCMLTIHVYNNDYTYCEKYKKIINYEFCLQLFSENKEAQKKLEKISSEKISNINMEIKSCEDQDEKKYSKCIINKSLQNLDRIYCDNFPEDTPFFQGKKALCYGLLSVKTYNLVFCNSQENVYYKNACRSIFDRFFSQFDMTNEEFISVMLENEY